MKEEYKQIVRDLKKEGRNYTEIRGILREKYSITLTLDEYLYIIDTVSVYLKK